MLDEFSTPTFLVACACGIGVCAIMAVVWLVSTRDSEDHSGGVRTDSDSQVPSKKGYRKKQFPSNKRKREGGKDSGEEEEEASPKSILKQSSKEEDEDLDTKSQSRPHHVEFHVETPPSKERVRTNPPTPHPAAIRKSMVSECVEPIPISDELKKPTTKPTSAAAASSNKPSRKAMQKSPPVAATTSESVPVPAQDQQLPTKPSVTKKIKSKSKQATSSLGESVNSCSVCCVRFWQ